MVAYIFGNTQSISDPARFKEYMGLAVPTVTQYGGKFFGGGMGSNIEIADGEWLPAEICAFEFASLQKAKEWYNSAEYQAVIAGRLGSTVGGVVFIDGG